MSNSNEENISNNLQPKHELVTDSSVNNFESADPKPSSFVQSLRDGADKVTRQAIIKTRKVQENFFYGNGKKGYRAVILVPEGIDFNNELPNNILLLTSEYEAAKAGLPVIAYAPNDEYEGWAVRADSIETVLVIAETLIALCIQSQQGSHDQNDDLTPEEVSCLENNENETNPKSQQKPDNSRLSVKGITKIVNLISRK